MLVAYTELRYKHLAAMERAKAKFDQIDKEYGDFFGRYYGGQIEEYKTEGADIVLVTSGSATGTAKTVVDALREKGMKVGLVKIRMYRPSPEKNWPRLLKAAKLSACWTEVSGFGWNCGPMYQEVRALTPEIGKVPLMSFIDGIANMDITAPQY